MFLSQIFLTTQLETIKMAGNAPTPQQMMQMNMVNRQIVLANSIKMKQQIFSQAVDPTSQPVINVTGNSIRNVGLLLGFLVEVTGTVSNGTGGQTFTRTNWGNANMVQQFRYDDLSNYTRIQTPGWHLAMLNSVRQGFGFGGVYANNIPIGYGVNYPVYEGGATIAHGATSVCRQQYYVPISYSAVDLRGSIWMGTVSATSNLQITLPSNPTVANTGNPINAVYQSDGAITASGWSGNVTVTVYQIYLDQVPRDAKTGAPILPLQDINTVYELKQTTFQSPTTGQDFPMAYSNFRSFLSTMAIFDNGGTYNAGSDINYWSLASANFTNIFKLTPEIVALEARASIMTDFPTGTYFFESRDIPINTINYGNMELNINASSANAGARVLVGYEAFALVSQVVGASSLAGG
jgi:hypothetical protein